MFQLYAEKNQLTVQETEPLTSGSVNVVPVTVRFSADWEGFSPTAVFRAGKTSRRAALDDAGGCLVPWEVLAEPGHYLMVGVCGESGGTAVLPTVWASLGLIQEGAVTGGVPQPGPLPESGAADHRTLSHRDTPGQHPITAIAGLKAELDRIPEPVEALTNFELEEMLT